MSLTYPYFEVENDLVYWVDKRKSIITKQLLVPRTCRNVVLNLAHSHPLGDSWGWKRQKKRFSEASIGLGFWQKLQIIATHAQNVRSPPRAKRIVAYWYPFP
ncbi:hypothetical protein FKM82_019969 [Ascaphus truei]